MSKEQSQAQDDKNQNDEVDENEIEANENEEVESGDEAEEGSESSSEENEVIDENDPEIILARKDGWVPLEEYRGNPNNWKTAAEFNQDGKRIAGILHSKNKKLEDQIARMQETLQQTVKFQSENKKRAVEKALREYEKERREAIEEADYDRVTEIEKDINSVKKDLEESTKENESAKEYVDWEEKHEWMKDDYYKAEATMFGERFFNAGFRGKKLLEAVERKMIKTYPELSGDEKDESKTVNENKSKHNKVSTPRRSSKTNGKSSKEKTFDDVPKEDQALYFQQAELMGGTDIYTEKDFLSQYEFDD